MRESQPTTQDKPRRAHGFQKALAVVIAMLALGISWLILPQRYVVRGDSMAPTLRDGDVLHYSRFVTPKRGDIVIFHSEAEGGILVVKRVIGVAGDTLAVGNDGSVIRNGTLLEETYAQTNSVPLDVAPAVTVGKDMLFVMGDNRPSSIDSRDGRIGQVPSDWVFGCVTHIVRAFEAERGE